MSALNPNGAMFDPEDPAIWKNAEQNMIRATALVDQVYPALYRMEVWNRANSDNPIGSQSLHEMPPAAQDIVKDMLRTRKMLTDVPRSDVVMALVCAVEQLARLRVDVTLAKKVS